MSSEEPAISILGSHIEPIQGSRLLYPVAPNDRFEVTVRVRPRTPLPSAASTVGKAPLSHQEFDALHGADPKDLEAVATYAERFGLKVLSSSVARRSVFLSGTAEEFRKAFAVTLNHYEYPQGTYRGRIGTIKVPASLSNIVEAILGFDNRPVARPHVKMPARLRPYPESAAVTVPTLAPGSAQAPVALGPLGFDIPQVADLYHFPTGLDGTGQVIGIIELGGGYAPADLQAAFQRLNLPTPQVIPVSVGQGVNTPGSDAASGEVNLDIQIAGAVAPGATIVVYFTRDASGQSFLDAVTQATHDTVHNPSVLSISWGGPESVPSNAYQVQFDQALQAAATLGITVCVAAGDNGAADEPPSRWDNQVHVDFPASSPNALACGGTSLQGSGGTITSESVWNSQSSSQDTFSASGGGVSDAFPTPSWQDLSGVPNSLRTGKPGRGVPDVTGDGDDTTGYNIVMTVNGTQEVFPVGGTSAVAPLWAGLVARINQGLNKRVGFLNPVLYGLSGSDGVFRDITQGNNQVGASNLGYTAGPGWDACSGLGSPNGVALLAAIASALDSAGQGTTPPANATASRNANTHLGTTPATDDRCDPAGVKAAGG